MPRESKERWLGLSQSVLEGLHCLRIGCVISFMTFEEKH